ncbi:Transporter [Richelia intracellularis]|nr:Transporter [Richelia intracellularis]
MQILQENCGFRYKLKLIICVPCVFCYIHKLGVAESGDDFTKFSTISQWFQTLIHPALMQRHKLLMSSLGEKRKSQTTLKKKGKNNS